MSQPTRHGSVLVSDDENDIRFLLRSALERAGFEVHETGNGRETFEAALEIHPTVITTDILEPCVSGLDALDMLKAEHTTRDIPVIVVTCMHDPAHRNKAFALGAAEYMTKPLSLSAYLRSVESVAARR